MRNMLYVIIYFIPLNVVLYFNLFLYTFKCKTLFQLIFVSAVGLVVVSGGRVSILSLECCGFKFQPSRTKDYNGTQCLSAWHLKLNELDWELERTSQKNNVWGGKGRFCFTEDVEALLLVR